MYEIDRRPFEGNIFPRDAATNHQEGSRHDNCPTYHTTSTKSYEKSIYWGECPKFGSVELSTTMLSVVTDACIK